jgi:hypothetical protein
MKYCIVVFDEDLARIECAPFVTKDNLPDKFIMAGLIVFGPYNTLSEASHAGRTLSGSYSWCVRQMHGLSEELGNPAGALHWGDSPDA